MGNEKWLENARERKKEEEENKKNSTSSGEDWLDRARDRKHNEDVQKVDSSYINLFVDSANSFFNSAEEEYNKVSWGNASRSYQNRNSTYQDLQRRSDVIREWLNSNKDSLDASAYSELSAYLDYFGTNATSILDSFAQAKEYYGQWATEDEYNAFAAYKKDYDEKASLDLDAAAKEIEELERRREELEASRQQPASNYLNGSYMLTNQPYAAAQQAPAASPQEQELYELKKLITQKQQYLNLAKRIQESIALSGAVNNADFDQYNDYVSTESDGGWSKLTSQYGMGYGDLTYEYINGKDSGIRGEIIRKASIYSNKGAMGALDKWTSYNYMDENEIAIYNYYYAKDGKEAAEKYLNSIQDSLNQRAGSAMAGAMDDNTLLELAFGVAAGVDQFESGMEGAWQAITGNADYIPVSSTQYASQMVREDLADAGPKLPEWLGGASLGQVGYDTITTGTNMAPSILASVAIGALNPLAGAAVGKGLMGTSAAGNAYQQKLNDGYSQDQARAYGVMVGASEVLLESLLGGISKMGGGLLPDTIIKNLNSVDNAFAKFATSTGGKLLIKSGSEAIEEGLQEVIEPFLWQAVSGEEASVNLEEALYSALLGFVTGGMFEGGDMMLNTAAQNSQYRADGRTIKEADGGVDALMALANEVAGATTGGIQKDLAKQTSKVENRASNKNVGRLYDTVQKANDQVNAPANQVDIAKSLEEKGFSSETANDIAAALVARYNGQELTSTQQRLLKSASKNSAVQEAIPEIKSIVGQSRQKITDFQQNILGDASRTNPAQQSEANAPASGKVDAQNEIGTESRYEVSADGKTYLKSSPDEAVSITGVASIKDGKMTLKLEDGREVSSTDLEYGSEAEALVYEAVARMDASPASAWAMIKGWDQSSGVSAQEYATDLKLAYTYGKLNYKAGMKKLNVKAATAFQMGRADAASAVKPATQASTEATVSEKNVDKKIIFEGFSEKEKRAMKGVQKASMAAIDMINKTTNLEVHVYKSYKKNGKLYVTMNGKERLAPNGYFIDGNKIYIDINAGNNGDGLMLYTMSHEVGHYIAQWNAQDFKAISDFLFEHYGEDVPIADMLEDQKEKLKNSYKTDGKAIPSEAVLEKEAQEELVCDMLSRMLADKNAYDKLMELKQKDLNTFQKLGKVIEKVLKKIAKAIGIYDAQTPDFKYAASVESFGKDAFRQLQDLYMKAFVQADANFQSAMENVVEESAKAVPEAEIITDGAVVTDGEGKKYSIRSMKADIAEGQMFEDLKNVCGWTQRQVNELKKNLEDLVAYMTPFRDILDMNESYDREGRRFSPYKPNSDPLYKISMDFSTLCSKRLLTQYVIENLQLRENRPMSAEEQMAIRDMLNEYRKVEKGLQVACAMCYVEAARLKSPKQITKWMEDPGTQMKNYFADKDPQFAAYIKEKQADFKESRGYDRDVTKNDMSAKDVRELNKIRPRLRSQYEVSEEEAKIIERAQSLPNSTYLTAGNLAELSETDPVIYQAYTAFVRTATRSKSLETDEPYYYGDSTRDNGNGIIVSDSFIEAVNRENGMRFSSWSDWRIQHLLDYITAVIDNSVRGAAMHGYTKFGEEVRVLGKTGMMFNMSGVAGTQTGLNEDGSLSFSSTESIDVNEAIQLRDEFPETAGLQCIGVSNDHIIALLRSDIIDYVIPYHVSGLNAALRRMADIHGWDDYTTTQHAAIDKSMKLEDAVDKEHWHEEPVWSEFFVGYDTGMTGIEAMRASADRYVQMCKDRGLKPKFEQFVKEDNYWKLLIDRKMINQKTGNLIQQKPVTPTFDFGTIKEVVDRYVQNYDSGLEARALNHIVENWDSIPKRIKDLKKQGSTKAKKAVDTLANQTLAAQPVETVKKYSVREQFYKEFDAWDKKDANVVFTTGTTSDALLSVGMKDQDIVLRSGTVLQKLKDHPEMTLEIFKNIPDLLEHPVIIQFSDGTDSKTKRPKYDSSITVLGELYADVKEDGKTVKKPVLVSLELLPTNQKKTAVLDFAIIKSAYSKNALQQYINENSILYIDPDKKRTDSWLSLNRLQLPLGENRYGPIRRIAYVDGKVKVQNPKNMTAMQKKLFDAGIIDEFGNKRFSERDTESVSNRSLLANALEGAAQNEIELNRLQEYKGKISLIEAEERKLGELTQKIRDLSFAKGPKDTKAIRDLQFEANQTANRISTYDKQLLRLEASKPLQDVLTREKKLAYKRAEQKGKEALAAYREKAAKTQRELLDRWQESRKKGIESRQSSYVRGRIKAFKERLESSLLKPTDRRYVPIDLIKAMVEVCGLIDTDTELYNADGSINKAQEKRNLTKEKLQNLKDEYEKLKTHSDPIYAGEFDKMVYAYLTELRDDYSGKNLREMSLDELTGMYEILVAIEETLRDARKLIGWDDAENVYEAGDAIVAEQAKITQSRKDGKRNAVQIARDKSLNLSLSPVRNVERMSGYHGDSYLLKLFKKFEQGIRKKNKFVMDAYKSFEHLTSGKEYDDAIYKEVGGKKYTDVNGRKFGISKMQMMQTILSHEREEANGMNHIENSGFSFADLDMLSKGRLRDAISEEYSHRVPAAVNLVAEFAETLKNDKWCQDYMTAARKFFNGTAKDAINETSIALKHRIIAKDKSYIPFEVDKNFVVREISAENDIQQTINSYGMLKDTKKGASQPLIITGLNNILDRHIDQVGNVYGLAIDVRNFNKVWNVRSIDSVGNDPTVKAAIQRNWGNEGVKHIEQAVQDIQGPRHSEQSALYKKVKSGYIGATFLLNLSVVTKQIGSLYSSTSMLKWRGPLRQVGNLLYTMVNSKKISAEVDKYTATAWMRRQGLSDAELHTLMTEGKKTFVGRLVRKLPTIVNPGKYITAMDHAVALSLWRYAKQDTAKRTGLKGEELLKATAEFYDEVVENTQSMTDVLHRPEIQKRSDVISEAFAMFKTDLYQMAGQLQVTAGRFNANKTKENGLALGRTVYAVAMSAVWAQLMTTVFALLRYKVNQYRDDEDEELTYESWLKRQGFSLAGDLMGYILPIFGSEMVGFFESIMYGESEDIVDSIALTAINDLYDIMITIGSSVKDGEMPDPAQIKKLTIKALQVFGIPANNIIRTYEAIQLHAKDIANGEFLSFEAGVDRSPKHHIHRIVEAMDAGNTDVAAGLFEEAVEETAMGKAEDGSYGKDELNEAKSALKTALADKYKNGEVSKETAEKILAELFDMDKDEIYWTFDKWGYTKENGSSDDYSKYNEFYTAVETGKNLKAVIKEYTDNGVEMKTLSSQITSHFKPLYIEMSNAEKANIKGYLLNAMTAVGYTREEAEEKIGEWEFESKYGFSYAECDDAYLSGDITRKELKRILMNEGGKTEEEADLQIQVYDWEGQGFEGATIAAVREYNEHCADYGVPKDVYLHIRKFSNNTENDVDETTGKTIYYSAMKKVMAEIHAQPGLTAAQKDAIARSLGWAEKNIQKYKLW